MLIDKELNNPIPAPRSNLLIKTILKFVVKTGTKPKIKIIARPSSTVFFLPIPLIIKLLNSTNTVIIIAGIVANDSTEANPILGF